MCVEAISIRPSLPLPLCPQVRFLHLRLHSFPANILQFRPGIWEEASNSGGTQEGDLQEDWIG